MRKRLFTYAFYVLCIVIIGWELGLAVFKHAPHSQVWDRVIHFLIAATWLSWFFDKFRAASQTE